MITGHRETDADVVVVGGGTAGLATAIAVKRSAPALHVMVLEKAAGVGRHLLSGAIIDPAAFQRLLTPEEFASLPLGIQVRKAEFRFLTARGGAWRLPFVLPAMSDRGLWLADLPTVAAALAKIAENLGVEILTGTAVEELMFEGKLVSGVRCGDDVLTARHVVLAEGPGGPLTAEIRRRFPELRAESPCHALAIREMWQVPPKNGRAGDVAHTFGAPLGGRRYGGGFVYRPAEDRVVVGFAVALDSGMPEGAFELFEAWKRHPFVARKLAGGTVIGYGARLIPEAGWPGIPNDLQAGNVTLAGDAAGLVDPLALKGVHLGVEVGRLAGERIAEGSRKSSADTWAILPEMPLQRDDLPFAAALKRIRNHRAGFSHGLLAGMMGAGLAFVTHGLLPPGQCAPPSDLPNEAKGETADSLSLPTHLSALESSLSQAHLTAARAGEPPHVGIIDPAQCAGCPHPCWHFCPAGTYAPAAADSLADAPPLVHAENCLHCHTCLLRCPRSNVRWTAPSGGVGPDFSLTISIAIECSRQQSMAVDFRGRIV